MRQVTSPKDLANHYGAFFSGVMGRLKDGITTPQAQAELTALYQRLQAAEPPPPPDIPDKPIPPQDVSIRLMPGGHGLDAVQREFGEPLQLVLMLVATVLLIASANVAGLLLARGAFRAPEFATRAALGAGQRRLIRQLLTEGALLAGLGGLVGLTLAWWGAPILASLISLPWMPIAVETKPDLRVLTVAFCATASAALLASLLPAWRLSQGALHPAIGSASRAAGGRFRQSFARGLVVIQLALSLLLVTGVGLLLNTMVRLSGVDPGFRPDHVVALEISHEGPAQPPQLAALYSRLDNQLNSLAGVRHASLSWLSLFGGSDQKLRHFDPARPEERHLARIDRVSARYFDTVGMSIARGREFTDADNEGAVRVAVVNEALIKARFERGEAIGRRLTLDFPGERERPFTVVGVVRDSKYNDLREKNTLPMIWVPLAQAPFRIRSVMLRVQAGTEAAVARQAQATLSSVDRNLMVRKTTTLASIVDETMAREHLMLGLSAVFGGLALLLAAVALYGTLAFAVARRTREIGVRLALGADRASVLRSIVADALKLVLAEAVLGIPLALAGGHTLRAFLFGVEAHDVPTLAGACVVLAVTAIAAAYIPARRAASVDPMTALRYE